MAEVSFYVALTILCVKVSVIKLQSANLRWHCDGLKL